MATLKSLNLTTTASNALTDTTSVGNVTGQTLTVELWARAEAQTGNRVLLSKGNRTTTGYTLFVGSGGELTLYIYNGTSSLATASSSMSLLDGCWHHWAAVKTAAGVTLYRDGISVGTSTAFAGTALVNAPDQFMVGFDPPSGTGLVGYATEIRVWNVARTQAEIDANRKTQLTGAETGLVAYWPCTEGSGATVESLPSGQPLTLTTATWSATEVPYGIPYATQVLADTPAAYWRLGDTAGTTATDSSGNARHGTYTGSGVTLNQAGALTAADPSVAFNGAGGQMSIASAPTAAVANVTIECWAYLASLPATGCFVKVGADTNGYGIGVGNTHFGDPGSGLICLYDNRRFILTGRTLHTGWNHVALVVNASGRPQVYHDGVFVFSDVGTAPIAVTGGVRVGGYEPVGFPRWFAGRLDEVAQYGAALTAGRINSHYTAAAEVPPSVTRRWDGSAWQVAAVQRWDGGAWVAATVKRADPSGWV